MLSKFSFRKNKQNLPTGDVRNIQQSAIPKSNGDQKDLDKKLVYSLSAQKMPSLKQLKYLPQVLTPQQNRLMAGLAIVVGLCIIILGVNFFQRNFEQVPAYGGEHVSGLVGAPQYINPLLSQSNDVDSDLVRLIFSGLLKYDKNLQLVSDLADHWSVSADQKVYTVVLKDNLKWSDGEPLTTDDIVFTFQNIEDPDFKSPLFISFRGVAVEKVDSKTVRFTLPQPYPSFLELLTVGILPQHIWSEVPAINANLTEYNIKPIGSGPWQFNTLVKDRLGNIKSYTLTPNPNYHDRRPYLDKLTFKFYPDFESAIGALKSHSIDGISFLPKELKSDLSNQKNLRYYSFYLPQYTAVFFNQKNNPSLKDKTIRKALTISIDKNKILNDVLQGEGEIINGPILPISITETTTPSTADIDTANQLLDTAGWTHLNPKEYQAFIDQQTAAAEAANQAKLKKTKSQTTNTPTNAQTESTSTATSSPSVSPEEKSTQPFYRKKGNAILEVTLTTVNQPEDTQTADLIKTAWESIGVKVNVDIIDGNRIGRDIIKPRSYEALLFGIIVGADADPYPFWDSSQVADPGLNLALYANRDVDKLIADAKNTTDSEKLKSIYSQIQAALDNDIPAIFLYSPTYTYVADKRVGGIDIQRIVTPADRFNNVEDWYMKTTWRWRGGLH